MPVHYFLNIGSNLGNRKLNISRALRELEIEFGYFETSRIIESAPSGFDSKNQFANIAVMVLSDKSPQDVLHIIQEIERKINKSPHRDQKGRYQDRELDIDIMAADDILLNTEELEIPHPRLAERTFYLEPFAQIAPAWRHPATGLNCGEMLESLPHP